MPVPEQLIDFVGYGPQHPRFLFIGPEEWSEGQLLNVHTRINEFPAGLHDRIQACQDLARAYFERCLHEAARGYLAALEPGREKTWTFAAKLLAALRPSPHGHAPDAWMQEYRALGTLGGDTLLAELFPLPKPGTGKWPAHYTPEFGYANQNAYYDDIWPRDVAPGNGHSPRADVLAEALDAIPLAPGVLVFGYGRGGRGTEFWDRLDRLFGVQGEWHIVLEDVAEIARHASGAAVARLAHPSRGGITEEHIPKLVAALQALP